MMTPDDHETSALSLLQNNETSEAQVHAILALASAINQLAEAHNNLAIEMIEHR